ncbi:non-ribosomal peptide synthetase [Colletotrichum asianum]
MAEGLAEGRLPTGPFDRDCGVISPVHQLPQIQTLLKAAFVSNRVGRFRTLSYAELDEKSSKIANELVMRGVRAESKVALLFEKSGWNIVATMAVLKAGGSFVPLDPFQPDGLNLHLVDKIQPKTVLSSKTYTER